MIPRSSRWTTAMLALAVALLLIAPSGARATLILEATQADFTFATAPVGGAAVHTVEFVDNNPIPVGTVVGAGQPTANPDGTTNLAVIGKDENLATGALGIGSSVPSQVGNFSV